jgi:hypothetical protein
MPSQGGSGHSGSRCRVATAASSPAEFTQRRLKHQMPLLALSIRHVVNLRQSADIHLRRMLLVSGMLADCQNRLAGLADIDRFRLRSLYVGVIAAPAALYTPASDTNSPRKVRRACCQVAHASADHAAGGASGHRAAPAGVDRPATLRRWACPRAGVWYREPVGNESATVARLGVERAWPQGCAHGQPGGGLLCATWELPSLADSGAGRMFAAPTCRLTNRPTQRSG